MEHRKTININSNVKLPQCLDLIDLRGRDQHLGEVGVQHQLAHRCPQAGEVPVDEAPHQVRDLNQFDSQDLAPTDRRPPQVVY